MSPRRRAVTFADAWRELRRSIRAAIAARVHELADHIYRSDTTVEVTFGDPLDQASGLSLGPAHIGDRPARAFWVDPEIDHRIREGAKLLRVVTK